MGKRRGSLGSFVESGRLLVNGTDILKAPDHTVPCGNGQAVFHQETNTLTLINAKMTRDPSDKSSESANGVENTNGELQIVLEGTNSIAGFANGIYTEGRLKLCGEGSLSISAVLRGICSVRGCEIKCGSLNLEGIPGIPPGPSCGILSQKKPEGYVACSSHLTIRGFHTGIEVPANALDIRDSDIKISRVYAGICGGDYPNQAFSIKNSVIDIETAEAGGSAYPKKAIFAYSCRFENCRGQMICAEGYGIESRAGLLIKDSSFSLIKGHYEAIYSTGNIVLSGSRLNCQSTGFDGIYCDRDILIDRDSDIFVSALGIGNALYTGGNITVDGARLSVQSDMDEGIISGGRLALLSGAVCSKVPV